MAIYHTYEKIMLETKVLQTAVDKNWSHVDDLPTQDHGMLSAERILLDTLLWQRNCLSGRIYANILAQTLKDRQMLWLKKRSILFIYSYLYQPDDFVFKQFFRSIETA